MLTGLDESDRVGNPRAAATVVARSHRLGSYVAHIAPCTVEGACPVHANVYMPPRPSPAGRPPADDTNRDSIREVGPATRSSVSRIGFSEVVHAEGPTADWLVALGAGVLGAAAYVATGSWRSSGETTTGSGSAPVAQTALTALLAAACLVLSVRSVQGSMATYVGRGSDSERGSEAPSRLWVRTLALPAALWVAIIVWVAAGGRSLATYALAYGAALFLPAIAVQTWASRDARRGPEMNHGLASPDGAGTVAPRSLWPLPLLFATVLALWLPVELSLFPPLPRLGPVGVPLDKFVALAAGLWLFLVVRPMRNVGYGLVVDAASARIAVAAFFAFAAVAVPLGLALGFLAWNPRADLALILLRPPLIYFTIGIPEEFLFRGVLQREIAGRVGDRWAIAIAAVIFGLAHAPSVAYIVLATLAGLTYGWVYHRTGRVAAAAVTHTLVDAVWVILLRP